MLNSPNVSMNAHAPSCTNTTSNGVLLIHPGGGVASSHVFVTSADQGKGADLG